VLTAPPDGFHFKDDLVLSAPPDTLLRCAACGKDYPHIHLVKQEPSK
jgi:hypothetical protein